jgi:hypothetical protein
MKSFFVALFVTACCQVSAQQTIINDKNAVQRDIPSFTGIKVSGGMDVYLSQGDNYSLAVSANDEKYIENIKTEVRNDILYITYENGNPGRSYGDKKLRAYISFTTLASIEGSGACEFYITDSLNLGSLLIRLSGASDIKGMVTIANLSLELSGASMVKVNGNAQNVKVNASGASDVKSYDLKAENCVAKLSGASDVRLTVTNSIEASASGASTFYYHGNPDKKDVTSSGASSIAQKD